MLRKIVAAAIIVLVGAAHAVPASAEPRGWRGWRGRGWRGHHYGQRWRNPNPLGSILGGFIGGFIGSQINKDRDYDDEKLYWDDDPRRIPEVEVKIR